MTTVLPERRLGAVLLVALAALAAVPAAAAGDQAIRPAGPPRTINETAPCSQGDPDVAALGGGGFVAVWSGEIGGAFGIGARVLDADGRPLGGELELRTAATRGEAPSAPRVAAGDDDGFVVAWIEVDEPALTVRLLLQTFDRDGTPRGPAVEAATASPLYVVRHALATDGEGRPALVWTDEAFVRLRLFEADLGPRTEAIEVALGDAEPFLLAGRPAVSFHPHPIAPLLVAWEEAPLQVLPGPIEPLRFDRVRGRFVGRDGTPEGEAFLIHQEAEGSERSLAPAAAPIASLGWVVTWAGLVREGEFEPVVQARVIDPLDPQLHATFRVDTFRENDGFDPDVAVLGDGSLAIVWSTTLPPPPITPIPPGFIPGRVAKLRLFNLVGIPLDDPVELATPLNGLYQSTPVAAVAPGGERPVVVWRDHDPVTATSPPVCPQRAEIRSRGFARSCRPLRGRACLVGDRFAVALRVDDPRLGTPPPRLPIAFELTGDTGLFWLFRPENPELLVKIVDGREINGRFWVFSGALSDLGYEITVTDTLTTEVRRYANRPGELASRADTRAFTDPDPAPESEPGGAAVIAAPGLLPSPSCPDPHLLCLFDGRFEARVEWRDPRAGATDTAFAEPWGDRAGTFWFFRGDNRELAFKMLDGRAVNGFFWVFFGGLTDLEYTVFVEDRQTGAAWRYDNPPFTLTSHADTRALSDSP